LVTQGHQPSRIGGEVAVKAFLFGLLVVALPGLALADAPVDGTTWYSIVTGSGAVLGHASRTIMRTRDGTEIVEEQDTDEKDEGSPSPAAPAFTVPGGITTSSRTVREEDAAGRTVSVSTSSKTGLEWHNDWWRNDARIVGGKAEVTHQTPAETRVVTVALPPGVRFDGGEALLRNWKPAASPRLEFDAFNIDAMAVEHVVIEAVPDRPVDPRGTVMALRKRYDGATLLGVSHLTLDAAGAIVAVTQPTFGMEITIRMTDKDTALAAHPPYRLLPAVMSKSPYRIAGSAMLGHIRYRFGFKDGIAFTLPQTGEQRVTAGPGFATVDICADCGPGLPSDAATLADARKATAWMQSDDPRILTIAAPVAKLDISDTKKMEILAEKTRLYLGRIDFAGHYSALETLSRHAGDCTEAATLLAALGRAAGIPTRVADGLVYSRESYHGVANIFMPHSWTLAWTDGRWRSFDAALDTFDNTHIALVVGDGDQRELSAASELASLLVWDNIAEVRASP
jgi:hypothetical protein